MEHFVSIIFKNYEAHETLAEMVMSSGNFALNENETNYEIFESTENSKVIRVEIPKNLSESESDALVNKLANKLFDAGYENFDIEVSVNESFENMNKDFNDNDYDVAEDLIVFMRNDPMFYRRHLYPALIDVQEAVKDGGKISKKTLLPVIEKALNAYINKFNIKKEASELLNDQEKIDCISKLLKDEAENFRKGAY